MISKKINKEEIKEEKYTENINNIENDINRSFSSDEDELTEVELNKVAKDMELMISDSNINNNSCIDNNSKPMIKLSDIHNMSIEDKSKVPIIINKAYKFERLLLNGFPKTRMCPNIIGKNENDEVYFCLVRATYKFNNIDYCINCYKLFSPNTLAINNFNPRCQGIDNCNITPSFAFMTDENKNKKIKATHCEKCSLNLVGFRSIKGYCIENDCWIRPTYGKVSYDSNGKLIRRGNRAKGKATHCKEHGELLDYEDVCNPLCSDCDTRCTFGLKKSVKCLEHKDNNMISATPKCITPHCEENGYKQYDNRCSTCFRNEFPHDERITNHKSKEKTVVDHILLNFPNYSWIVDRRIDGGCSLRRPDLYLDMGQYVIIIEIDENQHQNYPKICEINRTNNLVEDASKGVVLIRFNPDSYKNSKGIKVNSCWSYTPEKYFLVIEKSQRKLWEYRLRILCEEINKWIPDKDIDWSEGLLKEIKLFYDER